MKKLSFLILLIIGFTLQSKAQSCSSILGQNKIRGLVKVGRCVWSATNGGLVKFDTATFEKTYFTKANSDLPINALNQIAADASGNLWITTAGGLLVKFDGSAFTTFDLAAMFSITDSYYQKTSMVVEGNQVYVCMGSKLLYYNGSSWTSTTINYTGKKTFMYTGSIQYFQNSVYFAISTYNSSFQSFIQYVKFDGSSFTLIKEFAIPANGGPPADEITTLFTMDAQGNFWIAMYEGGISRMDHTTLVVVKYSIPVLVKNCPEVYVTVMVFFNDKLCMGSIGKGGMLIFNTTTSTWISITDSNSSIPKSDILSLVYISANTLYIGNDVDLVRVSIPDKQCTVHSLNYNKNKFDFFDTYSFHILGNQLYLSGEKYFGDNDSIRVYDTETSEWFTYKDYGGFNRIANKITRDNSGKLWMCNNFGVYYFETSTHAWVQYTTGSAGSLQYVSNMLFDKNNNMWLHSNGSLIKINSAGVMKTVYNPGSNSQFNDLCYDNNNSIYSTAAASSTDGFVKIDIVSDAITYYKNDNYGHALQYVYLTYVNDTLYYRDNKVLGKIHNGNLVRLFEISDYVTSYTIKAPVKQLQSFCVDKAGKIWMVDQLSNKVLAYDATTGFKTYDYTNSCISRATYEIKCDEYNRKWLKGGDGIYTIEDNTMMTTPIDHAVTNISEAIIFPNPVYNQAHIQLSEYSAAVRSITIMDLKSSENVAINDYSLSEDLIELNLGFLKQGIYILRITTEDDKERNLKFVKIQ